MKPIADTTEQIAERLTRAMVAHQPHQAAHTPRTVDVAETLQGAGYGTRAIKASNHMTGPGLECAKNLEQFASKDGLIILLGPTGRGKTVIACHLAAARIFAGQSAGKYLTVVSMLDRIKQCWARKEDSEPLMSEWRRTPFLVIDEFQNRPEEKWDNLLVDDLLNSRYTNELPTLLIANLTLAQAQHSLGPRIMDRANECGGIVDCAWPSYRA